MALERYPIWVKGVVPLYPVMSSHWRQAALRREQDLKPGSSPQPTTFPETKGIGPLVLKGDLGGMTWCHSPTQPEYLAQSVKMIRTDSEPILAATIFHPLPNKVLTICQSLLCVDYFVFSSQPWKSHWFPCVPTEAMV